jgi:hypothetical protein
MYRAFKMSSMVYPRPAGHRGYTDQISKRWTSPIAEHAFGLDRQPIISEDGVRNDGELCAMLAADDRHRGVVSTSTAGPC